MGQIRQWWHSGEDGELAVYRLGNPVVLFFMAIAAAIFIQLLYPGTQSWMGILSLMIPYVVLSPRRAILLGKTEILYRPVLVRPKRVKFEEVVSIKKTRGAMPMGIVPILVQGLLFRLKDDRRVFFPMDTWSNRRELLQRVSDRIGKPIE